MVESILKFIPPRLHTTARQFIKFGVTGTVGALVDFSTYNIMTRLIGWRTIYYVLGYEIIAANLVSVFLAIVSNFILNKYWTFRDRSGQWARQWVGYFMLNAITFALNQLLTSFFAFRVPLVASLFGDLRDNAAKVMAVAFILFINFIGSKFIIFRRNQTVPVPNGD